MRAPTLPTVPSILSLVLAFAVSPTALADKIDDYVLAQMSKQHIAGLSIAVLKAGKPVKVNGYGKANLELDTRATPETVYQIGSLSKQLIAAGVVLLNGEGKLGFDDSIGKYIEDAPAAWQPITVRHLLTHTSGLVREMPGFQEQLQSDTQAIGAAYDTPLVFKPGDQFQYSNLGYSVLAQIITRAAQKPWPQYIQERIFAPLGMTATRTTTREELIENRADGYTWTDGKYQNAQTVPGIRPSGAFVSTVRDLSRWEAALDSDELFAAPQRELLWTAVKLNDGSSKPYGFGWQLDQVGKHRRAHHAGTMYGFRSELSRYLDDRLTVIVLTNAQQALPEKLAAGIAAFYIPDLRVTRKPATVPATVLDSYTGRYQASNGVLTVTRSDAQLVLTLSAAAGNMDFAVLTPESKSRFFDEDNPRRTYAFDTDAEGHKHFVILNEEGKETVRARQLE